jgi:uncharacterized protein YndB with AHSA1/START domain
MMDPRRTAERETTERETTELAVVVASVEVTVPPGRAFELFTAHIGTWWPLETHSIAADEELSVRAIDVRIEPGVGGRIVEVWSDGQEVTWGAVLAWDPPHRLLLDWVPNRTRTVSTEVEVTFVPSPTGTLVRLEHRGWERLGDRAVGARTDYESGWPWVLGRYARAIAQV